MNREQLIHDLSAAWVARDHWQMAMEEAQAKRDEAQSRAWELELKLFEPASEVVLVETIESVDSGTITSRVRKAFDHGPKRVSDVALELGLMRHQVQVALARLLKNGWLRRTARGMYVSKGTSADRRHANG